MATYMLASVRKGDLRSVKEYIEGGFDVSHIIPMAFQSAVYLDKIEIVKYFVSIGIDVNELELDGNVPKRTLKYIQAIRALTN